LRAEGFPVAWGNLFMEARDEKMAIFDQKFGKEKIFHCKIFPIFGLQNPGP
jgi:hypothetical protein